VTTVLNITQDDDRLSHALLGNMRVAFDAALPEGFIVSFYTDTAETFSVSSNFARFQNVSGFLSNQIVVGGTPGRLFQFVYKLDRKVFILNVSEGGGPGGEGPKGEGTVGGATDANMTTIGRTTNSHLAAVKDATTAMSAKIPVLGVTASENSLPVVLATDQTLPLPSGAATEDTLSALKAAQHIDLLAVLSAVNVTHADLVALTANQHADLTALLNKQSTLPTGSPEVDRSGTIAAANVAQTAMAANALRKYFELQNLDSAVSLWFRKDSGVAAVGAPGSLSLAPGGFYTGQSTGALSVASTLAGHKYTALEAYTVATAAVKVEIVSAPKIVGTPTVGTPLSITSGVFSGASANATMVRRIYVGNTLVATANTYTPVAADIGKVFTVDDVLTDGGVSTHSMSAESGVAIATPAQEPAPAPATAFRSIYTMDLSTDLDWSGRLVLRDSKRTSLIIRNVNERPIRYARSTASNNDRNNPGSANFVDLAPGQEIYITNDIHQYWAQPKPYATTALTSVGTTATATVPNHGLSTGDVVRVLNAVPNGFRNDAATLTVIDANTLTFQTAAADLGTATSQARIVFGNLIAEVEILGVL
jgi:hypothetical protein